MPNQEPAFAWPFGNGPVRVGTQGLFRRLFRLCLNNFVAPFLLARLTAPGSPRMPWLLIVVNITVDTAHRLCFYAVESSKLSCDRLTNLVKYCPMPRKTLKVILKNNAKLDKMPLKPARTDKETFNWKYVNWLCFFIFLLPGYFSSTIGFLNVALVRVSDSIGNF